MLRGSLLIIAAALAAWPSRSAACAPTTRIPVSSSPPSCERHYTLQLSEVASSRTSVNIEDSQDFATGPRWLGRDWNGWKRGRRAADLSVHSRDAGQ